MWQPAQQLWDFIARARIQDNAAMPSSASDDRGSTAVRVPERMKAHCVPRGIRERSVPRRPAIYYRLTLIYPS